MKICIFLSRSSNTHFIFYNKEVGMFVVKSGNHVSTPLPLASWSGEVWELRQRTQISTHSQHLNWNNSISAEETEQFGFITCFLSYDPAEDNGSGCISWSFELGPLIESGEMGANLPRSTQLKSINDVVFCNYCSEGKYSSNYY